MNLYPYCARAECTVNVEVELSRALPYNAHVSCDLANEELQLHQDGTAIGNKKQVGEIWHSSDAPGSWITTAQLNQKCSAPVIRHTWTFEHMGPAANVYWVSDYDEPQSPCDGTQDSPPTTIADIDCTRCQEGD